MLGKRRAKRAEHVSMGRGAAKDVNCASSGEALGDWTRFFDNSRRGFKAPAPSGLSFRLRLGEKRIDPVAAQPFRR